MMNFLKKYNIYVFIVLIALLTIYDFLNWDSISMVRKLVNLFAIFAVLHEIEEKLQKEWQEEKIFESKALENWNEKYTFEEKNNNKYFITFPYPYMNNRLHLGHAFSFTKCEFQARFQKLLGKNVLLPFGFHCTGILKRIMIQLKVKHLLKEEYQKKKSINLLIQYIGLNIFLHMVN